MYVWYRGQATVTKHICWHSMLVHLLYLAVWICLNLEFLILYPFLYAFGLLLRLWFIKYHTEVNALCFTGWLLKWCSNYMDTILSKWPNYMIWGSSFLLYCKFCNCIPLSSFKHFSACICGKQSRYMVVWYYSFRTSTWPCTIFEVSSDEGMPCQLRRSPNILFVCFINLQYWR